MRPIGFSTGALAKGDFVRGLQLQREAAVTAVELSALRDHELGPFVESFASLDLSEFEYISFHAPSKLRALDEKTVFELVESLPHEWPIIVHPEIIRTPRMWASLGERMCIENMDNRKSGGRTLPEVRALFEQFPKATFCLDVGHAKQIDPTMVTALLMLREFGTRLRQVHVSDVGPCGEHLSVGIMARVAFSRLSNHIPETCPLIIESIVPADRIEAELETVASVFAPFVSLDCLERTSSRTTMT